MENTNSEANVKLFDDAYKNIRMGSYAVDLIIDKIKDAGLKTLLEKQNEYYLSMTTKLDNFAQQMSYQPKDINVLLKTSSFLSINLKTILNKSTSHIAQMLIEGTTMGITTLTREVKQNSAAQQELIELSNNIIANQEKFIESLKKFL